MKVYQFTEEGARHAARGAGNQDACFAEAHGGRVFAYMSDGMGSADLAGEAAQLSIGAARELMGRTFVPHEELADETGELTVRASFAAAYNALQRRAQFDENRLNSLLNTFMAVYFNEATGRLCYGYCGDGGLVVLGYDGSMRVVVQPHKGETAFQTTCLLDFEAWEFGCVENVSAFLLMTDGLFDALCPQGVLAFDDVRAEAVPKLLRAPLSLDDARMKPYLDEAFSTGLFVHSPRKRHMARVAKDELGALFGDVSDDRSVVIVAGEGVLAGAGASAGANVSEGALAGAAAGASASVGVGATSGAPGCAIASMGLPRRAGAGAIASSSASPVALASVTPVFVPVEGAGAPGTVAAAGAAGVAGTVGMAAGADAVAPASENAATLLAASEASALEPALASAPDAVLPLSAAEVLQVRTMLASCGSCPRVRRQVHRRKKEARYGRV